MLSLKPEDSPLFAADGAAKPQDVQAQQRNLEAQDQPPRVAIADNFTSSETMQDLFATTVAVAEQYNVSDGKLFNPYRNPIAKLPQPLIAKLVDAAPSHFSAAELETLLNTYSDLYHQHRQSHRTDSASATDDSVALTLTLIKSFIVQGQEPVVAAGAAEKLLKIIFTPLQGGQQGKAATARERADDGGAALVTVPGTTLDKFHVLKLSAGTSGSATEQALKRAAIESYRAALAWIEAQTRWQRKLLHSASEQQAAKEEANAAKRGARPPYLDAHQPKH